MVTIRGEQVIPFLQIDAGYPFGCGYNKLRRVFAHDCKACLVCGRGVGLEFLLNVMLSKYSTLSPGQTGRESRASDPNPHQGSSFSGALRALSILNGSKATRWR